MLPGVTLPASLAVLPGPGARVSPLADVLALHPRQGGEHGEHDAGRVVRALQLTGEELQADAGTLRAFASRNRGAGRVKDGLYRDPSSQRRQPC